MGKGIVNSQAVDSQKLSTSHFPPSTCALPDWKAAVAAGQVPPAGILRKAFVPDEVKAVDGAERVLQFTISTAGVDRDNDTIAVEGWDLADFQKTGGPVLWAHDYYSPPIGRALAVFVEGSALKARAEFMTAALSPFADMVYRMVLGGFIRSTSVGFMPLEWTYDEVRRGVNILRQTLYEFSLCSVPANPQCVIDARAAGIDTAPLKAWAEQVLDAWHEQKGLWLPTVEVEQLRKAADGKQTVIIPSSTATVRSTLSFIEGQCLVDSQEVDSADKASPQTIHSPLSTVHSAKSGRVLSAANEERIRGALAALQEVLGTLGEQTEGETAAVEKRNGSDSPSPDSVISGKGVVPRNVSTELAAEDTPWSAPTLGDFTDKSWGDLTDAEKGRIAGHCAWAAAMPPATFGDLKLPHHQAAGGAVVLRGVVAAAARLNQADIPAADVDKVKAHIAAHYRQWDRTPPWEMDSESAGLRAALETLTAQVVALRDALLPPTKTEPVRVPDADILVLDAAPVAAAALPVDEIEIDFERLQAAITRALGAQLTAITGRIY